jgi:adenine-specific DNA-methyltransferase
LRHKKYFRYYPAQKWGGVTKQGIGKNNLLPTGQHIKNALYTTSKFAYIAKSMQNNNTTTFDSAYVQVQQLVQKFTVGYAHYMSSVYSEAEARQDFIDPFFTALGWDVSHLYQTNPYQQEVKIERSQKQQNESSRKRADYAFFTAPNFKDEVFFCEAKKPSVLIENNAGHYFQTQRYGWNAGCPISVLTDFEEFVIIDCRQKPNIKFALNGRHKAYKYTEYSNKEIFAEIYWLFSHEAVAKNSIANYTKTLPKPKGKIVQKKLFGGGYQPIDDSFLEEIDAIRENIAKAFKKTNDQLNSEQLTEATQRTVDRLVFIRFLEDKFIEAEEHVSSWRSWKDFISDCRKLDAKYNGVVFKKHFMDEPDFIGADEDLFLNICSDISNINSPYDFNYIPIHILGSIYERFLGKVVVATDKRVRIEEKPEVRKAGGVYYTPKYIVDYIVQNTVGKIITGLTPKQITEKTFADIACGSGSFLIGVYDCLLDYHKKYYTEKLTDKTEIDKRSEDFGNVEYVDKQWRLTLKLKQDILLNNIYGVDIDAQAVEVTQLSLFLKMLEDESVQSTTAKQGAMFSKVLPNLSANIVCGNSLIGWDIMDGQLFDNEALKKLNPMDYDAVFPKIMRNGGFDAVVGNPPYVSIKMLDKISTSYFVKHYLTGKNQTDLYALFVEKALKIINNISFLSFIIPDSIIDRSNYISTRSLIISQSNLNTILVLNSVFKNVNVGSCVFTTSKKIKLICEYIKTKNLDTFIAKDYTRLLIDPSSFSLNDNFSFLFIDPIKNNILSKLNQNKIMLGELCFLGRGEEVSKKAKFILKENIQNSVPFITGDFISRYTSYEPQLFIKKADIKKKNENLYSAKIVIRQVGKNLNATFDNINCVTPQSVYSVKSISKYENYFLLGLINSRTIDFIYQNKYNTKEIFPRVLLENIKFLPIPKIDFSNPTQKQQHDKLVTLVTQMLATKKQLSTAVTDSDKNFFTNQCSSIDKQIDNLVYSLYGLTEEEIKIVEGV